MRRLTILTVALCVLAAGCGDDDATSPGADGATDPARPTELTLMLNWTPNAHHAGIYLAEQEGWYADAGIDLRVIEPAYDTGVEVAVAGGAADVGIAQAESLLPARAAGVEVEAVATLLPTNDSVLMSLAADGITEPADLAGATYGGFGGALETELISTLVSCGGADPDAVEQVEVGNVDYLAGLGQDRFDVVWVFEGWDVIRARDVEDADVETIAFEDHLDCIPDWYTPLLLTSETMLAERADVVETFLAVTARGYETVAGDPPAGAAALVAAVPELDPELVEPAVAYYAPRFVADGGVWGEMDAAVWVRFAEFLVEAGILEDVGDVGSAWTNDLLPEAPER